MMVSGTTPPAKTVAVAGWEPAVAVIHHRCNHGFMQWRATACVALAVIAFGSACGREEPAAGHQLRPADVSPPASTTEPASSAPSPSTEQVTTTFVPSAATDLPTPTTSAPPNEETRFTLNAESSDSFVGTAPANAEADPLQPSADQARPAFVIDELRWLVPDCCRVIVVLQDEQPKFPDDQLIDQLEAGSMHWDVYDIGAQDGSLIVAVTTVGELSLSVSAQTLSKSETSTQSAHTMVRSLAQSIKAEPR